MITKRHLAELCYFDHFSSGGGFLKENFQRGTNFFGSAISPGKINCPKRHNINNISLQLSILVPSTIPVVEDKSLKTQYQVIEVDPAADKGNSTTSSANYESSPGQILSSLQTVSQSAGERGWQTTRRPRRHLVPIVVH